MARISIAGVGHRDTSLGPCSKVRAALSMAHGHRRLCGDAPTIVDSKVRVTPICVTTATLAPSPTAAAARLKVASTLSVLLQRETKCGTVAGRALYPDFPAMGLDNVFHDREA